MMRRESRVGAPAQQLLQQQQERIKDDHIKVVVRSRPLNAEEKAANTPSLVSCDQDRGEVSVAMNLGSKRSCKKYSYDMVFGQYSTQNEVYTSAIKPVVDDVLLGFNCTVFAYGQTGTGKTYTMEGDVDDPELMGMIPRAVTTIFDALNTMDAEYTVKVSFLELYNEELQDLLSVTDEVKLRILDDKSRLGTGVACHNLEEVMVQSTDDILVVMKKAMAKRQTGETKLNKSSSRSHCIFTMTVHMREVTPEGEDVLKVGKLNLVDLAGSECIGRSGATNQRAREAGNINKSLLTLGRVISALVEKTPHIPYRDSKLTRLLQESLGGRAKTCIIATVAPSVQCLDETISTLDYANRAKNIKNKPEANQRMTKRAVIKEYAEDLERLRQELATARAKDGVFLEESRYNEMVANLEGHRQQITELEDAMAQRQKELAELQAMFEETSEKLEETKVELTSTKEELATTVVTLEETKEDLEVQKVIVEETKVLVCEHEKTEGKLRTQTKELQNTLEEAKADVGSLHSKVERQTKVEQTNKKAADNYRADATDALGVVSKEAVSFCQRQIEHHNKMTAALETLAAEHVNQSKRMVEKVVQFGQDSSNGLNEIALKAVPNMEESSVERWRTVSSTVDSQTTETMDKLKASRPTIAQPLDRIIGEILVEQEKCLSAHTGFIQAELATSKQQVIDFAQTQSEKSEEISKRVASDAEQSRLAIEKQANRLENFVVKERQRIDEAATKLTEQFAALLTSFKSEAQCNLDVMLQETKTACQQTVQETLRAESESKRTIKEVMATTKQWCEDVNLGTDKLNERVEVDNTNLTSSIAQTREQANLSIKLLDEEVEKLSGAAVTNKDILISMSSEATVEINKLSAGIQAKAEGSQLVIEQNKSETTAAAQDTQQYVQTWTEDNKHATANCKKTVENFESQTTEKVDSLQQRCDDYVSKEIVTDTSNESVPGRKPYTYDSNIPQTAPHEEILVKYRERKGNEADVEEEQKQQLVQDENTCKPEDKILARKHSTASMKRTELGEISNTFDNAVLEPKSKKEIRDSSESSGSSSSNVTESSSDEPPEVIDLLSKELIMTMKVKQLRRELQSRSLSVIGNKATLQQRLLDDLAAA